MNEHLELYSAKATDTVEIQGFVTVGYCWKPPPPRLLVRAHLSLQRWQAQALHIQLMFIWKLASLNRLCLTFLLNLWELSYKLAYVYTVYIAGNFRGCKFRER